MNQSTNIAYPDVRGKFTRIMYLTRADINFQFRYGFYSLYLFISIIYIVCIRLLPLAWRETARIFIVFSDPAALGLFFIGAILLFEKSERVLSSIAVSPVCAGEYVLAKALSIACISLLSGIVILAASGDTRLVHQFPCFLIYGLLCSSCLCTCIGILIGTHIRTLNQFLIATIPAEILLFVPPVLFYAGINPRWLLLHPGVAVVCLLQEKPLFPLFTSCILLVWMVIFLFTARRSVQDMFEKEGQS